MIAHSEKALQMKSIEQLREILTIDLGYSLDIESHSKDQLIASILEISKAKEDRDARKFDFLDHLKSYVPMTEQMITDAFFTSFTSFSAKYLNNNITLDLEQKKTIWYEIRDIIISNNLKVHRPGAAVTPEPLNKINKETATIVKQSLRGDVKQKQPASAPVITPDTITSIDKNTLVKKGDRAKYIINVLISEGEELMKMKPRQVMDRYAIEFDEAISDGYAYDKIVEQKKNQ